eukprot:8331576-Pyramimonas_sp.AAC.1
MRDTAHCNGPDRQRRLPWRREGGGKRGWRENALLNVAEAIFALQAGTTQLLETGGATPAGGRTPEKDK